MPSAEQLKELQSKSLEEKIQISTARIIEWYENWGGQVYVSNSGGVDSAVLSDLVHRVYPDVVDVYCDTGLEYPELRNFILQKPNVIVLKPIVWDKANRQYANITFSEVIKRYGYPLISKEQAAFIQEYSDTKSEKLKNIRLNGNKYGRGKISKKWQFLIKDGCPIKVGDKCCDIMKKNPAKKFEHETGLHPYIGTMTEESDQRKSNWIKYGCNSFNKDRPTSNPLSFWTKNDILHYIKKYEIPYASVYGNIIEENGVYTTTGCKRTGCVFCGFGCHLEKSPNKFQKLKQTHPQLYNYCMRGGKFDEEGKWVPDKGLGMAPVLEYIGIETDWEGDRNFPDKENYCND